MHSRCSRHDATLNASAASADTHTISLLDSAADGLSPSFSRVGTLVEMTKTVVVIVDVDVDGKDGGWKKEAGGRGRAGRDTWEERRKKESSPRDGRS